MLVNQTLACLFQRVNQLIIHSSESILHEQTKCSFGVVPVLINTGGSHVMMIGAAADPLTHVLFVEYAVHKVSLYLLYQYKLLSRSVSLALLTYSIV